MKTLILLLGLIAGIHCFPNLFHTGNVETISFRFADRDSNRFVDFSEFKTELRKYDGNFNSQLSEDELRNCIIPWSWFETTAVSTDADFRKAFTRLDKNNDGKLTFEEARIDE
ncbi:hypothetical protein SNE40_022091 [Patella caerulea]|uniref:EF-hand domain-containing protein n=1 Tax=Patella caerulea TaxID=87958 RepID=A0AAN8GH30_PATCE